MVTRGDVYRLDYGHFVRPAEETGTGRPRVEPVLGYLVRHPDGLVLFDTGLGSPDPETAAHYQLAPRPFAAALRALGAAPDEVRLVVNCHLHFDHCGGNAQLSGTPIVVQAGELEAARRPGYTLAELVDFPGARYEAITGETELLGGVWVVPTPGHTPGHQSLVVRCADGTVILAGQSHESASQYAADQLAWRIAKGEGRAPLAPYPAWVDRLQRFDPARVLFAHDLAVWEPRP
jgi:N-acyl homoserine lactone hydrolase